MAKVDPKQSIYGAFSLEINEKNFSSSIIFPSTAIENKPLESRIVQNF
jgi:hypothetical protein